MHSSSEKMTQQSPTPIPEKDKPFETYDMPTIPNKEVYTIVMVGDSMTEVLGPHGGKLSEFINTLYQSTPGNQRIIIDNYAKGSTNILGLSEVMKQKVTSGDVVFAPLLSRSFDLLLIESFGYNPLSQFGRKGGLEKQTQTLEALMKLLTTTHPQSAIVFVATIAPNHATYGQDESPGTTQAQRTEQAEERVAYIKNHMDFAREHNIPLINIYDKSATPSGTGNLKYINPGDHIHPSAEGVDFISHEIANYIYDRHILLR